MVASICFYFHSWWENKACEWDLLLRPTCIKSSKKLEKRKVRFSNSNKLTCWNKYFFRNTYFWNRIVNQKKHLQKSNYPQFKFKHSSLCLWNDLQNIFNCLRVTYNFTGTDLFTKALLFGNVCQNIKHSNCQMASGYFNIS